MKDVLNFIDGEYCAGAEGRWFDDVCPLDGKVHARVSEAAKK